MLVVAGALSLGGSALLALSQPRNWRTVAGQGAARPATRPLGWVFVGLALVVCVIRDGGGFAALQWPLLLAGAAFTVAMVLAYRPSVLRPLAAVLADGSARMSMLNKAGDD